MKFKILLLKCPFIHSCTSDTNVYISIYKFEDDEEERIFLVHVLYCWTYWNIIYLYSTNSKKTHKSCVCFQHAKLDQTLWVFQIGIYIDLPYCRKLIYSSTPTQNKYWSINDSMILGCLLCTKYWDNKRHHDFRMFIVVINDILHKSSAILYYHSVGLKEICFKLKFCAY